MTWSNTVALPADATLGTPLSATSLAANTSVTAYSGPVGGISYSVFIDCLNTNGATSTAPFTKVSMIWKDGPGGNTLDIQHWFILQTNVAPASSNTLVVGRGPTSSRFLTVLLKNLDTANGITLDFQLMTSTRVITRHDWRSVSNNVSGSYTFTDTAVPTPVSDCAANILGTSAALGVLAGATTSRINGLYAGQTQLAVANISGTGPIDFVITVGIFDPEFATPFRVIYQTTLTATVPGLNTTNLSLPRLPSIIEFANNGSNTITFDYCLITQEFAS